MPKFKIPEIKVPGLKSSQLRSSKLRIVYAAVAAIAIAFAVYFFTDIYSHRPQLSKEEFRALEEQIQSAYHKHKEQPKVSSAELCQLSNLPKQLENRRNFLLASIYEDMGEKALAFHHYYVIDPDYLPRFAKYRLAKMAEGLGLERLASEIHEQLSRKFSKDPRYSYELAKSYLRQNKLDKARDKFISVQSIAPDSDFAIGANYYLAGLCKDEDPSCKIAYLRDYLIKSPSGNLSGLVVDEIANMSPEHRKQFADLSSQIGLSYFSRGDYAKALSYFTSAAKSPILEHAESLVQAGKRQEALALLLKRIPSETEDDKAKAAIEYLLSLSSETASISQLQSLAPLMSKHKDKILWHIAELSGLKSDYEAIYTNYPDSLYAAESMATVFWREYKESNYDIALSLAKEHWDKYPESKSHAFVAFWAAKIYEKQGEKNLANAYLQNIIEEHPLDYYRFRAEQCLNKKTKWYLLNKVNEFSAYPNWRWTDMFSTEEIQERYGNEVAELIALEQYQALLDSDAEANQYKLDDNMKMWLYAKAGDTYSAIKLGQESIEDIKGSIDLHDKRLFFAYPLPYADLIADEAGKRRLIDPMLAQALIKQESHYRPEISSKAGAVGLMQVMPFTARDLARRLGIASPKAEELKDPSINIKLGIRYMEDVFERFSNNMVYAVASYNAGPGAVSQWMRLNNSDLDIFVEEIPYNETKNYVKKVLSNYWIYKKLYA